MLPSTLPKDSNGAIVQMFSPGSAYRKFTVKGSGETTASIAGMIGAQFFRLYSTVAARFIFVSWDGVDVIAIAADDVAATGHYVAAGVPYDICMIPGTTTIAMLAVGASSGDCYISELGTY